MSRKCYAGSGPHVLQGAEGAGPPVHCPLTLPWRRYCADSKDLQASPFTSLGNPLATPLLWWLAPSSLLSCQEPCYELQTLTPDHNLLAL